MARVVLGSYMVRYPLGGMMSWVLQWLVGFQRLGHEVYFVEKAGYANACYDPTRDVMSDDCSYGTATPRALLSRFDLGERWCFVDAAGDIPRSLAHACRGRLATADAFVDMGTHGAWLAEADAGRRPRARRRRAGIHADEAGEGDRCWGAHPHYDHYYSTGQNIGTAASTAPTAGRQWRHVFHPVVVGLFEDLAHGVTRRRHTKGSPSPP